MLERIKRLVEVSFVDWTTMLYIWLAVPMRSLGTWAIAWFLYDCYVGAHKRMTRMWAWHAHLLSLNIEAFKGNNGLVTQKEYEQTYFTNKCGVGKR